MSDKRIIEQPASEEIFHDDWLVKDSPLNETTKIQASVFMALIVDEAKDGMVPYAMLATEWTALTTYHKDQVVIYNGELYRATDTNVSPTFNPSAWTKISFDTLYRTTLANVKNSICEEWSTSTTYTLNDCAMHEDKLYKCVADTATVGTWVSNEWELVSIYEIIQNLPKSASDVTYDNTDSGLEADNVQDALDEVAETITELSNTTEVTGTASGAIATFTDGADAPLKELKVTVTPYQDLHGYDAPWAGGAGKNKIPPLGNASNNGITMTTDINGNTIFNGTVALGTTFEAYIDLPSALTGDYVLSINNSQTIDGTYQNTFIALYNGSTRIHAMLMDAQNAKIVVTNGTITRFLIRFQPGVTVTNFKISVQLEEGSTATSYLPYSNICPISGWDEVNVSVSGVNVWDEEWERGTINDTTGQDAPENGIMRSKGYIAVKSGLAYYIKKPTNSDIYQIFLYRSDKTFMYAVLVSNIINRVYTIPSGCSFIRFRCLAAYGNTYNNDISINYPSTDTEYHAYNGQTYTIDLDGTRYGGTLDATNGVMTVDRVSVVYDGSENNWVWTDSYKQASINLPQNAKYSFTEISWKCNNLTPVANTSRPENVGNFSSLISSGGASAFSAPNCNTLEEFKTWASNNNIQFCYELATPITVQLAPTPVKSIEGENNISANCGDINNVEYVRNLNITINDLLSRING